MSRQRCLICNSVCDETCRPVPLLLGPEMAFICPTCLSSERVPDSTDAWDELLRRRHLERLGWILCGALDAAEEEDAVPILDLDGLSFDPDASSLVTAEFARRHSLVPVTRVGDSLVVAMADPDDRNAVDELHALTGLEIRVTTAPEADVHSAILRLYRSVGTCVHGADEIDIRPLVPDLRDDTIINLVNLILSEMVRSPATEVHVERNRTRVQVLYRIDGLLEQAMHPPARLGRRLIDCFRLLTGLPVPEPPGLQLGSFGVVSREGRRFDLHVSITPHASGEILRVVRSEA